MGEARSFGRPCSALLALVAPLVLAGCGSCSGDRGAPGAAASASAGASGPAVPPFEPMKPGAATRFFPADGALGYARVIVADKTAYAEAKLRKDGKDVATLTIADGVKPDARVKYAASAERVEGFPARTGGDYTSVLVQGRFQVRVSSATLDPEARKAVLASCDLKGLAGLAK